MGVYGVLYYLVAWSVSKVKKYLPNNWFVAFLLYLLMIVGVDLVAFLFYRQLGYSNLTLLGFTTQRLVPTLIFNTVLFLIMYFPTNKFFKWLGRDDYYLF